MADKKIKSTFSFDIDLSPFEIAIMGLGLAVMKYFTGDKEDLDPDPIDDPIDEDGCVIGSENS